MRARVESGIDEITWDAVRRSSPTPRRTVTASARPSRTWIRTAAVSSRTSPPRSSTMAAHRSHIIPGPYFGYWNSSMRLVTCLDRSRRRPATRERMGSHTASHRDIPLMRWAPQSAESADAGTPHTFSL